ncbi:MAG: Trimeric GatFAB AmidoTransferase(AdT) complex subunit [Cirrosporium novae-zelandiae]|nr:MAG: Trimeric GatFAB AmidoTransferase(AdT) complex subunit [Cirrosporium novae-zelandiae]
MPELLGRAARYLERQRHFEHLNAFIRPRDNPDIVRRQVKKAENLRPFLNGKPNLLDRFIAVKDNICTADYPTTCASRILKNFTSPYDAAVVEQLKEHGAIIAGKTNLDEFGMGSHSANSAFGVVKNHLSTSQKIYSAGGSSGGSAVAVATDQCYAALGTDTGGSVRLPAAYNGIVGFKPSYGLVSRWGVVAYANSLDTVGILARRVQEAREVFDIINRHDSRDPTNLSPATRDRLRELSSQKNLTKGLLRIGVPKEYNIAELDPEIRQSWASVLQNLKSHGHTIHEVSLPTTKQALSAYYILAPAEASSNLAKYDGVRYGSREDEAEGTGKVLYANTRGTNFGLEVQRRILLGAYSLSAEAFDNYFIQAQKVRRLVQQDFDRAFGSPNPLLECPSTLEKNHGVDVLVCPTAPTMVPTLETLQSQSPVNIYMGDVFTVPASLAGLPAISIPVKNPDAKADIGTLPIGLQVIGQYGDDDLVLKAGQLIESI